MLYKQRIIYLDLDEQWRDAWAHLRMCRVGILMVANFDRSRIQLYYLRTDKI